MHGPEPGDNRNTRVLKNFRSLFSPYGPARRLSPSSSVQSSCPPNKRGKWNSSPFKRETWTHEFFCLADRNRVTAPSKVVNGRTATSRAGAKENLFSLEGRCCRGEKKTRRNFSQVKERGRV